MVRASPSLSIWYTVSADSMSVLGITSNLNPHLSVGGIGGPACRVVEVASGGGIACRVVEIASGEGIACRVIEIASGGGIARDVVGNRSKVGTIFFMFFITAVFACLLKISRIHTSVHTQSIVGVPLEEYIWKNSQDPQDFPSAAGG